jgi:hypothetical protein
MNSIYPPRCTIILKDSVLVIDNDSDTEMNGIKNEVWSIIEKVVHWTRPNLFPTNP